MSWEDRVDETIYKVLINDEEEYTIWPAHRQTPPGWKEEGIAGSKEACVAYIHEVWTDLRPLSKRKNPQTAECPRQLKQD